MFNSKFCKHINKWGKNKENIVEMYQENVILGVINIGIDLYNL